MFNYFFEKGTSVNRILPYQILNGEARHSGNENLKHRKQDEDLEDFNKMWDMQHKETH